MAVDDEDADDEIVIKMPAPQKDEEGSSSEEEEEDGDEEEGDSESEEPSEEEAEWESSLFYCGLGTLAVRVKTQNIRITWSDFKSHFELCSGITVYLRESHYVGERRLHL